jgi:hypothetical protein
MGERLENARGLAKRDVPSDFDEMEGSKRHI